MLEDIALALNTSGQGQLVLVLHAMLMLHSAQPERMLMGNKCHRGKHRITRCFT